jgi:pilus assembly protein Flp/PilA
MLSNLLEYLVSAVAAAKSEEGQTMVEYGLILALVAIVAALALTPLGAAVGGVFTSITTSITTITG